MFVVRRNDLSLAGPKTEGKEVAFYDHHFCRKTGGIHPVQFPDKAVPADRKSTNKIVSTLSLDGEAVIAFQRVVARAERPDLDFDIGWKAPGTLFPCVNHDYHFFLSINKGTAVSAASQAQRLEPQQERPERAQAQEQAQPEQEQRPRYGAQEDLPSSAS